MRPSVYRRLQHNPRIKVLRQLHTAEVRYALRKRGIVPSHHSTPLLCVRGFSLVKAMANENNAAQSNS